MERSGLMEPAWLSQALSDPSLTDLCINGTVGVYMDRGAGLEPVSVPPAERLDETQLRNWVLQKLSEVGKIWDAKHPFVDAALISGHRIHVAFPPMARNGILVSIRRLAKDSDLKEKWSHCPFFHPVREATQRGESVLISGATGSGKTTLAASLLSSVSHLERIIALEDTPELAPEHPHFLSLVSRPPNPDGFGEVTLRALLKQTLRMRPDRIVLGECRGEEVLDLLQALNTGHRGALATLHANSARDALRRIELLCLLAARGTIPPSVIRELLTMGIQWVVHVKKEGSVRRISELFRIEGREGDTILLRKMG